MDALALIALLFIIITLKKRMEENAPIQYPVNPMIVRMDKMGDGHYGRKRTNHIHQGTDFRVDEGQPVHSPITGVITRQAYPYEGDKKYTGVHISDGIHTIKIFYMQPTPGIIGQAVKAGQVIGKAQAISKKYGGGMKDHIHLEVWKGGDTLNPLGFFNLLP